MNLRYRFLALLPGLFACAMPAMGQITITASDVTAIFAIGDSLANKIDTVTTTLNIGQPGSTSWDFSALGSDSSMTLHSVAVGSTPFASQFPSATHAFTLNTRVVLGASAIPTIAYIYFQLATNLLNLGEDADIGPGSATAIGNNIPADVFYQLPSTYNTTWTSTYLDTTTIWVGPFPIQTSGVRHNASYVIDAYGPMTIPGGSVHDALRIRKTDSTSAKFVSYIFLAKDGTTVQATAANLSQPDNGTIQVVKGSVSWNAPVIALPIELSAFSASPDHRGAGVLVTWRTISEVNNYGFEVQRAGRLDAQFATIAGGFVPGHGTTSVPQDYAFTDNSPLAGTSYYRLKQIDLDGAVHYTDPSQVDMGASDLPAAFMLAQNYPNPFNPATTIEYRLPAKSYVTLAVYNTLGERVAVLAGGEQEAGTHVVKLDGSSLASGTYFYRLEGPGVVLTKKLTLLR